MFLEMEKKRQIRLFHLDLFDLPYLTPHLDLAVGHRNWAAERETPPRKTTVLWTAGVCVTGHVRSEENYTQTQESPLVYCRHGERKVYLCLHTTITTVSLLDV